MITTSPIWNSKTLEENGLSYLKSSLGIVNIYSDQLKSEFDSNYLLNNKKISPSYFKMKNVAQQAIALIRPIHAKCLEAIDEEVSKNSLKRIQRLAKLVKAAKLSLDYLENITNNEIGRVLEGKISFGIVACSWVGGLTSAVATIGLIIKDIEFRSDINQSNMSTEFNLRPVSYLPLPLVVGVVSSLSLLAMGTLDLYNKVIIRQKARNLSQLLAMPILSPV